MSIWTCPTSYESCLYGLSPSPYFVYLDLPYFMDQFRQRAVACMFNSPEFINKVHGGDWEEFFFTGVNKDGSLQVLNQPCLLLWGSKDWICVPREEKHLVAAFRTHCPHPLSQAEWILGASHYLQTPTAARLIDQFFTRPESKVGGKGCRTMKNRRSALAVPKERRRSHPCVRVQPRQGMGDKTKTGTFCSMLDLQQCNSTGKRRILETGANRSC